MSKPPSLIKKLSEGVRSVRKKFLYNPLGKIGVSWFTVRHFKYFAKPGLQTHRLFNHPTYFFEVPEYFQGLREIFVEEPYKQTLPENALVIDCGAHIGLSILYIKKICPSAHIIAYEPDAKNFELLQKNVSSHQLQNVELKNEAVWKEDTFLNFVQDGNMSSKIVQSAGVTAVKVKAAKLKSIIDRKIDFLKIDIEGAEYVVIRDIADNLHFVTNLFIEYHGKFQQSNELSEIIAILAGKGFYFYIKEADAVYRHPFFANRSTRSFDVQLNIFAFREQPA